MQSKTLTPQQLEGVLDYTPIPNDHNRFIAILTAIKSEFGISGKTAAHQWARRAPNFHSANFSTTWQSIQPVDGVTCAGLYYEAKANGWEG